MRFRLALALALAAAPAWAQNVNGGLNVPGGGGGGSPSGASQVQWDNAGAFAGITGATTDGTTLTLVAPVLGTPASVTLTNATGLPIAGITGTGGGVGAALAITASGASGGLVRTTSPTLITPALGTPSALVGTNITGTASGLTAGNVTTDANLTGPITSTGNATAVAAQTGTGSTFVMSLSPTLTTPNLGTPSAVVLTNATGLVASTGTTATGTPSSTTFLRGDNTWSTAGGTGTVTSVVCGTGLTGGTITATGTCALDTTISAWFPAYVSANWYTTPLTQVSTGTAISAGTLSCYSFPLLRSVTIKSLGARVTTVGTTNFQVGIYADSGGFPNGAVLANTGNIINTGTGAVTAAISQTTAALTTGVYWACTNNNDSTAVFDSASNGGTATAWLSGSATAGNTLAAGGAALNGLTQTVTFNTWPSLNSTGWAANSNTKMPAVIFQVN